MSDLWLERDAARLRCRVEGTGPAILLLHGWALDLRLWDLLIPVLAGRHTLLRFDRRGFGLSSGRPSLRDDAADALAVLDAAGIARCAVVGMSQGARVAAALARESPARITHLVLDGAPDLEHLLDEDLEEEVPLAEYQVLLAGKGIDALRAALARLPLLRLARAQAEPAALLAAMLRDYPATDLRLHAPAASASPRKRRRRGDEVNFAQPTMVLNGAHDSALRRRIGAALAAHIPGACQSMLADAGHLAALDAPEDYGRAIGALLTRHI